MPDFNFLKSASKEMRLNILRLAHDAGKKGAHIAPSLSMVEIMSTLFCGVMDVNKDLFVLSKGHGGLCYYVALYQVGLITIDQLNSFEKDGSDFPGQPSKKNNNIIYSSGSLGLGLSYVDGLAYNIKLNKGKERVYILMGDGELNEGSVWESAMFAKQHSLGNIVAIIDRNGMQSDGCSKNIIDYSIEKIWTAFGWNVIECDGHDEQSIYQAFRSTKADQPNVIIANTIKGKGVSFMENNKSWHHSRLDDDLYSAAILEVEEDHGN